MNIPQFLNLLEDGDWYLDPEGVLYEMRNGDCPIWYAYRMVDPDEDGDAEDYVDAGVRIGLHKKTAIRIAAAADCRDESTLRKRLLKAAGVVDQVRA